jgi:hypothetical protein
LLIFVLALREKKKEFYSNTMSWTQGFISGMYLSFFCMVLSPFVQYVIYTHISPNFFNTIINHIVLRGEKTREEAQAVYNMKEFVIDAVRFTLSMGILTAAIVSLFLSTKEKKS